MKTVERGAEWLDEVEPGWYEKIDPAALDLESPCNCVLGQLYRADHPRTRGEPYYRAMLEHDLTDEDARRMGFVAWSWNASWTNLTSAWRRLIESRRERS